MWKALYNNKLYHQDKVNGCGMENNNHWFVVCWRFSHALSAKSLVAYSGETF